MAKEKKQDCGWQFPKALEIVKCKEGNKEFMKERPARRPFGNTVLICEYPLDGDKRRNLHCGRAARVYGVFNETAYPLQCD